MKKVLQKTMLLLLVLCLGACGARTQAVSGTSAGEEETKMRRFEETWLDLFDTVTVVKGYAKDKETFDAEASNIYDRLLYCYRLFDIYESYEGINNLKSVNDNAGVAPVAVDAEILSLLKFGKEIYEASGGTADITLGAVLSVWHEARLTGMEHPAEAYVPEEALLLEAKTHTGWELLEIDEAKGTVFLTDPEASLDVGAIAKGYAAEYAMKDAPEGYLLSLGGNVRTKGMRSDGTPWVVGVQNPEAPDSGSLFSIYATDCSVVTSGDYQRYYTVDGVNYHHLIDPDSCMPAAYWRGVTVLCKDSGVADALSTALFLMELEEGQALAARYDAEAAWIAADGSTVFTEGFEALIRQ
ncbi:MAG: FAD:protein FMN transferase [Lachnospiraceae bacterium]|nr:FAD:protein FMN transferase [Lachnospiraceae bacterium]